MFKKWIAKQKKEKLEYDNLSYFERKILYWIGYHTGFYTIFIFVLGIVLGWVSKSCQV